MICYQYHYICGEVNISFYSYGANVLVSQFLISERSEFCTDLDLLQEFIQEEVKKSVEMAAESFQGMLSSLFDYSRYSLQVCLHSFAEPGFLNFLINC